MEYYRLKKPRAEKDLNVVIKKFTEDNDSFRLVERANRPEYLYWDKMKYLPRPKGMDAEEFWTFIKLLRRNSPSRVFTVIRDLEGKRFTWQALPGMDYFLHEIDMKFGGALALYSHEDQFSRQRFISRGIMEEAIASSQLEGASTTRKAAKRMLLEKRKPSSRSEHMILNNYNTMMYIEETLQEKNLSIDILLDLHAKLTEGTLEEKDIGRFRNDEDHIFVCDARNGTIYHEPPSRDFFLAELDRLVDYANENLKGERFVHPFIKAVFLHFWIGFLHPFVDGNGRLARSLFYWYLLKQGYWAFAYLPVSRVIKKSPAQYRDAYVYTEQDDNDLTYFLDYNIRKINQAKKEFDSYIKRKETENRKMAALSHDKYNLNSRQIQVLRYFYKDPNASTSIKTHAQINGISRMTARKDLEQLEQFGFLKSKKIGRQRPFVGTSKISNLFE